MLQKLITVGNSRAFTISKDILSQIGKADIANVNFLPAKKRLIIDFDQEEIVEDGGNKDAYSKSFAPPLLRIFLELSFQCGRKSGSAPSLHHDGFDSFE